MNNNIVYIGMDVHTTTFTFCTFSLTDQKAANTVTVAADYGQVPRYIENLRKRKVITHDTQVICGYEAGCLGYSLYKYLSDRDIDCVILAPSTMLKDGKRIKTDNRDSEKIARCLAMGGYSSVYVPSEKDQEVKEYIRMRDDHKKSLKAVKQEIVAFCHRNGLQYDSGSKRYWTLKHLDWLKKLELAGYLKKTLEEYLITYHYLQEKIERFDKQIEAIAEEDEYREDVHKLICLHGIKARSALALRVEVGDFTRFPKACNFASFLGLVPGESSSGDTKNRTGITKAGNSHLRTILIEASQSMTKGTPGIKSKGLSKRQAGNAPTVIAYADKANERMRRKYKRMTQQGKKANVAKTAIAREMACFIWGIMTENMA